MTKATPYAELQVRPRLQMSVTATCPVDGCEWTFTKASGNVEPPSVGYEWTTHYHAAHDTRCQASVRATVVAPDRPFPAIHTVRCGLPAGHHPFVSRSDGIFAPFGLHGLCDLCKQNVLAPIHASGHQLADDYWTEPC